MTKFHELDEQPSYIRGSQAFKLKNKLSKLLSELDWTRFIQALKTSLNNTMYALSRYM